MTSSNRQLGVLAGLLFAVSSASASGAVIDPTNAVASSQFNTSGPPYSRLAVDTINGTGLSAVPTEANIATVKNNEVPDDDVTGGGMWLTDNGNGSHGVISYDLGVPTNVSAIYVWNYAEVSNANATPVDQTGRGAKLVDIYASTTLNSSAPGGGDSLIEHATFNQAATSPLGSANVVGFGNFNADYNTPVVEYTFSSPVLTQFVKLNVLSSWADAGYVGLSEVRFEGVPVPEPASMVLLGFGATALIYFGRKARRR